MPFYNDFKNNQITNLNQNSKRGANSDEESERDKKRSKSSKSDKASKQKLDEYDVDKPALVVIFNQENFVNKSEERRGTMQDVDALEKSFSNKNYFKVSCEHDLTKEEVQEEIESIANHKKYKNYSYVIILLLSHGNSEGRIKLSCGNYITNKEIWQPFCSVDSIWKDKPKLFIFQTCKGVDYTFTDNSNQPNEEVLLNNEHKMVPKEADILVAYSTVEGNVSMRTIRGTWYIQNLCEIINEYGKCDDIVDILTRVNQQIAHREALGCEVKGTPKELENKKIKQMPMFLSTLTKKFYFYNPANRS